MLDWTKHIDISKLNENIEALHSGADGLPFYVLNPIIDITFTPVRADDGDYERIVLDNNLIWHWEHNEYYPEYYIAQNWIENYPECLSWWHSGPPNDYLGWLDEDCPIYGENVNSLCWYKHYKSLKRLISENRYYGDIPFREASFYLNGKKILSSIITAYVNQDVWMFAPRSRITCEILSTPMRKRKRFVHWLNIGVIEDKPILKVYYPEKPKGDIRVLVNYLGKDRYFSWYHGSSGLFLEIISYYEPNTTLLDDTSSEFTHKATSICSKIELLLKSKRGKS